MCPGEAWARYPFRCKRHRIAVPYRSPNFEEGVEFWHVPEYGRDDETPPMVSQHHCTRRYCGGSVLLVKRLELPVVARLNPHVPEIFEPGEKSIHDDRIEVRVRVTDDNLSGGVWTIGRFVDPP